MSEPKAHFWEVKSLQEMSPTEWESLCDGCGKCCLNKLIDDDTEEIHHTDVACRLLDLHTCRCRDYADRKRQVPDCQVLTPEDIPNFRWLPSTCAYRLLSEGKPLFAWHPLISGDPETVHTGRISARDRAISEDDILDLETRIVEWPA